MATVLEVTVVAADQDAADRLAEESLRIGERFEDVLTTWRADGELARLNAHAGAGAIPISPSLARALGAMRAASTATGGAFDPAVGPIVERLRAGRTTVLASELGRYRIATALALEDGCAALVEGAALDAGGIGKGIALDAIASHLREHGAQAWFIDFGGSSQLAHGTPEDGRAAWIVVLAGIERASLHGAVKLGPGALSTSRARSHDDADGAIVDPRTGKVVEDPRMATVFAGDATAAEAWSTALIVLGRDGIERAASSGVEVLYEDAHGVEETSSFPR